MPLSDVTCKNAKPQEKPYKIADEKGMFLLVNPNGSKYFRLKYRFAGKEKTQKAAAIDRKKRLDAGLPIINSFEHVARDWLASIAHTIRDITHQKKIRRFELHTFPFLGALPIKEIKSPEVYSAIKPLIAKNELETAHRVHSDISAVFSYAIAHGFTDYDPAQAVAAQIPLTKGKAPGRTDGA